MEDVKSNLLEAQKHKDTFIANISHELRNPLGVDYWVNKYYRKEYCKYRDLKYLQSTKEAANHVACFNKRFVRYFQY